MCLTTLKKEPLIATKDIPVIKKILANGEGIFYNLEDENNKFMPWEKGFEYEELGRVQIEKSSVLNHYYLNGGVLHSKVNRKIEINEKFKEGVKTGYVRMYIPKGTKYWISKDKTEYASKKLVWY